MHNRWRTHLCVPRRDSYRRPPPILQEASGAAGGIGFSLSGRAQLACPRRPAGYDFARTFAAEFPAHAVDIASSLTLWYTAKRASAMTNRSEVIVHGARVSRFCCMSSPADDVGT